MAMLLCLFYVLSIFLPLSFDSVTVYEVEGAVFVFNVINLNYCVFFFTYIHNIYTDM